MDPITAIAIVNTAVSLAEMFGSNDYSVGNLMRIQTEMLNNISDKINTIQKGINTILESMNQMYEVLENVPNETVLKLYRSDLEGLIFLYLEKIDGYINEREENGILKANEIYAQIFKDDILVPIQNTRAKLMVLNNCFAIPIISTCLHIEINLLILLNQPKSIMKSVLKSYNKYYSDNLNIDLEGAIMNKKKKIIENDDILVNNFSKFPYLWSKSITKNVEYKYWTDGRGENMIEDGEDYIPAEYDITYYDTSYEWIKEESTENLEEINLLIDENYLERNPLFYKFNKRLVNRHIYLIDFDTNNRRHKDYKQNYFLTFIEDNEIKSNWTYSQIIEKSAPTDEVMQKLDLHIENLKELNLQSLNNDYLLISIGGIHKTIDITLKAIEKFNSQIQ